MPWEWGPRYPDDGVDDVSAADVAETRAGGGDESSGKWRAGTVGSCLTLLLAGLLVLITLMVRQALVWLNMPLSGMGALVGVFAAMLMMAAIPIGLLAAAIAVAVGPRARSVLPIAVLMMVVIVGTFAGNWISNASKSYFTPEIVGIVKVADFTHDDEAFHVTMANGQTMRLAPATYSGNPQSTIAPDMYLPTGSRVGVETGDLLLAGNMPERWYTGAGPSPDSDGSVCYLLDGSGYLKPTTVDLDWGLRLRYSAHRTDTSWSSGSFSGLMCLDEAGGVKWILEGP